MAKITIYSTTTCPYCHAEKEYLKSRGVEFEDVLIDKNPNEIPKPVHICNSMGVPCTHIVKDDGAEERILGFDKAKIDAALNL